MDESDRQEGIPKAVSITAIDIPFWKLVDLFIKAYVAWLVASVLIGVFVGIAFGVYLLLTDG